MIQLAILNFQCPSVTHITYKNLPWSMSRVITNLYAGQENFPDTGLVLPVPVHRLLVLTSASIRSIRSMRIRESINKPP